MSEGASSDRTTFEHRVDDVRRDLRERLEHEPPLVHERVGDLQVGRVDHLVAVQDQVQVDRPRLPPRAALAAEATLDLEQPRSSACGRSVVSISRRRSETRANPPVRRRRGSRSARTRA